MDAGGMDQKRLPNGRNQAEWTEQRMDRDGKIPKKVHFISQFKIISECNAGTALNAGICTNTPTTLIFMDIHSVGGNGLSNSPLFHARYVHTGLHTHEIGQYAI